MAMTSSITTAFFSSSSKLFRPRPSSLSHLRLFSSASPYPLYYELIHHRPLLPPRHRPPQQSEPSPEPDMDRSKRKYYRKRDKRMYGDSGCDSDSGGGGAADEFVELKPEVVDFPRLHAREQELYFYDAFAFPWEKEKHYRMVYQLEKKYFPDQSLDKAFVDPATAEASSGRRRKKEKVEGGRDVRDERALVFFDEGEKKRSDVGTGVSERKVKEFFKGLKKVPSEGGGEEGEPFLVSRRMELPPRWDGPMGTVVLVDKPKGLVCVDFVFD